ncbi:MAG: hypothetical protein ACR5K9_00290 [Wolbachia sp.]
MAFRIDNKDPLYKKLIKLPAAYYRLESNSNGYTIYSHIGTAEVRDTSNLKLQKRGDEIFLWQGGSPLKLSKKDDNGRTIERDCVIEQGDIIGTNKVDIIQSLQREEVDVVPQDIPNVVSDFAVGLSLYRPAQSSLTGVLNFINFNDENDLVLQRIIKENGGLYFTIRDNDADCSRTVYMSDQNGDPLPGYGDYQYQYKPNAKELEIIDLIHAENAKQNFTLQKGEKLSDDIYEANIVLNDRTIATLSKIGYYMLNDQLVMRNHVTGEKVVIPSDFHFLKVVKFDGNYKLTFCNVLGNEFFEYKRYDPQYSNVSDEYKFISLSCVKKEHNLNLGELFSHRPSFFITEGSIEPDYSSHYQADMFELTNNKKGRKMATLIDEFGYFNESGQFKHCNYHKGTGYRDYNSSRINKEYAPTDACSEFHLSDITLHTTSQELL